MENNIRELVNEYKEGIKEKGKLNLSLEECIKLGREDYSIVTKDGFVIDIIKHEK